jgi:hypothetical protein
MHVIERTKKQRKTDGAAVNSRNYMNGMYNYTGVDGRIYQTEKRMPSSGSRYTRIRSKEELKHDADITVTVTTIRKVERFFGGAPTPMDQVEAKYGLQYDKKEAKTYGDSLKVFQMICDTFPMAKNYTAWSDILISIKDHKPVRTEPVKIIRAAGEKKELPSDIKPIYVKGDLVWTIYRKHVVVDCDYCSGRGRIAADDGFVLCHKCGGSGKMESRTETVPAVAKCNIASWYTKRLQDGTFDIMYELDGRGAFGKTRDRNGREVNVSAWRLQDGGNLFDTEDAALKFLEELK